MKNKIVTLAIGFAFGLLVAGGIGVTAVTLTAKEIKYTPSDEKFSATNAEEALNEIYKIAEYEIPENTYFYEQGTEGGNIVRYKKINNEYFICDQYGKVEEGATAIDVTAKTLIPYTATNAASLNAGSAGYASDFLILGEGYGSGKYKYFRVRAICNTVPAGQYTTFGQTAYLQGSEDGSNWVDLASVKVPYQTSVGNYTSDSSSYKN